MDSFCEFITNPAWWSVILSAISTIAVIVIAYVQIKLQKRQANAQEYEFYKQLYDIIYDADLEINRFLFSIYAEIVSNKGLDSLRSKLEDMFIKFSNTEMLIMQKLPDFKLRTYDGEKRARAYQYILIEMANITSLIRKSVQKPEGIRTISTDEENGYALSTIIKDRKVQKSLIVSHINNETYAKAIESSISQFLKDKKEIETFKFAEHIAGHCSNN